jgi:hypothetical protein
MGCLILLGKRRFGTGFKLDNLTTKKPGLNINETRSGKGFEAFIWREKIMAIDRSFLGLIWRVFLG